MKIKYLITFLFLFKICLVNSSLSQYWEKIQSIPSPYSNNYWLDVYFHPSNPNYGWICGFNGMIIRTTDGGNTWSGSTVNAYHLESVHFPTTRIGYVSGVEGIFKSTDGGATWFDVTPPGTRDTTMFWGCFFLNENYGVLLGDGCFGRRQHFWLTTDGGNSWSVFLGSEDNSGLTDAILYPNGLGYASSSGRIWITQDSGRTWQVLAVSGPELWQEEITNVGTSFLVPYSGTTCTGGGNDGGMRFSTNNGLTWNSFRTGVPMFGTFLIDSQKGWACGYSTEVYYTPNGGINWERRNCGIFSGNLDDLWFIDENNGWVVGEGVYKLSNAKGSTNKNSINFNEICVGQRKYDTLWFKNYNFNDATISLSLSSPTNEFEIVSPGTSGYIQSCDSIRIIIAFAPKTPGNKNASLQIQYPSQSLISVPISGSAIESSAELSDTLIVINRALCGFTYQISTKVKVDKVGEFVSSIIPIQYNKYYKILTTLPLQLIPGRDNILTFEVTPNDTGWQEITYRAQFAPCDTFQNLKIRVYSVSPIINVDSSTINVDFYCNTSPIKLRVYNTGNDTLFFRKFSFSPQTDKLTLQGWASGHSLLSNFILPNQADTLLILIDSNFVGNVTTSLLIENNDLRIVNGQRNVLKIVLNIRVFIPKITYNPKFINFGKVCVGDSTTQAVIFSNTGNLEEMFFAENHNDKGSFITKTQFPFVINTNGNKPFEVGFTPKRVGKFLDTLILVSFNCPDTFKIVLSGDGVKVNLDYLPKQINLKIQKGTSKSISVSLFNSNEFLLVTQTDISGNINKVISNITIKGDSSLALGDTIFVELNFLAVEKGEYTGSLIIHLNGVCDTLISIPVHIEVFDKNLIIEPRIVNFGAVTCSKETVTKSIQIKNLSDVADTILNIQLLQRDNQFYFDNLPTFPLIINPYDSLELLISYYPNKVGYDTASVLITFADSQRNTDIEIFGFWGYSKILTEPKIIDFGELEYCQIPLSSTVAIMNTGNIPDSIIVVKGFSTKHFHYVLSKIVLAGAIPDSPGNINNPQSVDTSFATVTFDGTFEEGEFVDTLILGFNKCIVMDTIIVKGRLFTPEFSIEPSYIDLGEIWVGTNKNVVTNIINTSSDTISIKVSISKISNNVSFDSSYAKTILPSNLTRFDFEVTGRTEGEFFDTICFEISASCIYYSCLIIHYIIPNEQYSLTFNIGEYIAKPGDDIVIYIENLTPNQLLNLDTLNLSISFDNWLYQPVSLISKNDRINFVHQMGKLTLELTNQSLSDFINLGKPISILGKALYSYPDSTYFIFDIPTYYPSKQISFNLINGLLKVYPICKPIGSNRLELIPYFEISGVSLDNYNTSIVLHSSVDQTLWLTIYDLLGNLLLEKSLFAKKGTNVLEISNILPPSFPLSSFYIIISNGYINKVQFIPLR
jgi:hypothetical protein